MPFLRDVFLALSTNAAVRSLVVNFPLSRIVSRRFIVGDTLDEVLVAIRRMNGEGLKATLDVLGESVTNEGEALAAKDAYLRALDGIAASGVASQVSVKLTQVGLDINPELALANMRAILTRAKEHDNRVTIDMEDSNHTQPTLNVYKTLREEFDNVGVVIQSYLYRSAEDMQVLRDMGANVRLCKGAYKEPPELAFPAKKDVDANYIRLAEGFLKPNGKSNGAFLALATHDEKMIDWAKDYIASNRIDNTKFEFQMLYGIRPALQRRLAGAGYTMRLYVPFGPQWYPYFMRRLAERPANVVFILSNLVRR